MVDPRDGAASWTAWTAPTTLSASEAAKRVGMSESDLRAVNNIPPRMMIRTGSTLLVARTAQMDTDVTSHVADNAQISLAPEVVLRRSSVKARKGETVQTIAKRYGVSPASVAEWNSVGASSVFKLGQQVTLFLPLKSRSASSAAGPRSNAKTSKNAKSNNVVKGVKRSSIKPARKSKK